jgi:hypothetical protein
MLGSWIVDRKFVLTSATVVTEDVLDRVPMECGGLGSISALDGDGICDFWSSAEGSTENRSNSLLVHSSVTRLLVSLDGMGLVAHC